MNIDSYRPCPLCDSESHTIDRSLNGYTIVECTECRFLYVCNPDETTISEDETQIDQARHSSIPQPKRRHHYITRLIETTCGRSASVLEVGAGYGGLGKLLEQNGHSYLGFEPSDVRADIASDGGLTVVNDVYNAAEIDRTYDAVVIDNVLEHVRDPDQVLGDAADAITDEGVVIVVVPSRHDLRRLHPGWNDAHFWIPDAHINFFRPSDLERLYSRHGLRMRPFPPSTFGLGSTKDCLFTIKAIVERSGYYPLSLYTFGTQLE